MGCSRQYVYKLVAAGKLAASRISNRMSFVRRADIEAMLAANPYHRVLVGASELGGGKTSAATEKRHKPDSAARLNDPELHPKS